MILCCLLALLMVALLAVNLAVGSVSIPLRDVVSIVMGHEAARPSWQYIIMESRLPQAITAMLCGGSLAVSGLMLQTAFRNPLAGPDILGINGGAGLGVALVMLLFGGNLTMGNLTLSGSVSVIIGAFAGALAVTALVLYLSTKLKNPVMLLIVGIMVSYLASALISLLNFFSTAEGVHSYTMWGMGNFGGVSMGQLPVYCSVSQLAAALYEPAGSHHHGVLRPGVVHRTGCAAYCKAAVAVQQPPQPDASDHPGGRCHCAAVQRAQFHPGQPRTDSAQRHHACNWCAGDTLRAAKEQT